MFMIKKILLLYFLLFLGIAFAQQSIIISVQTEDFKPVEDAIVFNLVTNDYNYTDINGQVKLNYQTELDSFKIIIPSFEGYSYTISQIKKLNNVILLKKKSILLDEVMIISAVSKSNIFFKLKTRKKRFFDFTSPGGSIVSPYLHKKQKSNQLSSLSLFFDNSKLKPDSDIKIRLLIFKDNNKWIPLVESPAAFYLSNDKSEINISFKNSTIAFEEGQQYLIGFELINKEKVDSVSVLSTSLKNTLSYLKPSPNERFFQLEKDEPSFSLYYEIYFKE